MRYSRACLVALLLALSFALGCASAHAASLDEALAHFTADDFSETIAGIGAVAFSGDPRAETIIRALQDGRLMFSAESKAVYVKDESGKLDECRDRRSDRRRRAGRSRQCAHQQSAARRDRCGARRPDAACRRSRHAIRSGAGRIQVAGGERVADARDRIAKEQDPRVKRALAEARAAVILSGDKGSDEEKLAAVDIVRQRGDQDALALLSSLPADTSPAVMKAATATIGAIKNRLALWEAVQDAWYGISLGLGPAARRHRPRHHLRRHGRDQHGPWRDGHARRLCHLRRAGRDPRAQSGIVRLFARDRHSALVSVRRLPSAY